MSARRPSPAGLLTVADVSPMLAARAVNAFSKPDFLVELKWDGFRVLAGLVNEHAVLRYRGGSSASAAFPEVVAAVASLPAAHAVLDGELVVLEEDGRAAFQKLQKRFMGGAAAAARLASTWPAVYYAFDLLALNGVDLRSRPLVERKERLRELLAAGDSRVRYVDHLAGEHGEEFYQLVQAQRLEGIVLKRTSSRYVSGRSSEWVKVPVIDAAEFVVVGFTIPGRVRMGGLHLAQRLRRKLVYAGRVGTGFRAGELAAIRDALTATRVAAAPCTGPVPRGSAHVWVEPRIRCEVRFKEQTEDGLLRHPVFVRMHVDR